MIKIVFARSVFFFAPMHITQCTWHMQHVQRPLSIKSTYTSPWQQRATDDQYLYISSIYYINALINVWKWFIFHSDWNVIAANEHHSLIHRPLSFGFMHKPCSYNSFPLHYSSTLICSYNLLTKLHFYIAQYTPHSNATIRNIRKAALTHTSPQWPNTHACRVCILDGHIHTWDKFIHTVTSRSHIWWLCVYGVHGTIPTIHTHCSMKRHGRHEKKKELNSIQCSTIGHFECFISFSVFEATQLHLLLCLIIIYFFRSFFGVSHSSR